jgi:hypothetical protein
MRLTGGKFKGRRIRSSRSGVYRPTQDKVRAAIFNHIGDTVKGANVLVTINSKEPFGEPDDMKFWWKIFYAAREDWTTTSDNWEGVNWGLFSGDDEAKKTFVGRIVDHLERLECKTLLLPE